MLRRELEGILGGRVIFSPSCSRLTSIRAGGPALALARPDSPAEAAGLLAVLEKHKTPFMVIGQGSNLLFPDDGYNGVLIKLGPGFEKFGIDDMGILTAGAAAKGAKIVGEAYRGGFSGMECLFGIPCSMGGALKMNAGCGGGAVGDCLLRLDYMDSRGREGSLEKADLKIGYRRLGGLPKNSLILGAEFQLLQSPSPAIKTRLSELAAQRKKSQPGNLPSAGCFFKNPPGESAGRLIDECGLKGFQVGGARVSEVHANFLVNAGGARAGDFLELMAVIVEAVERKRGLILEPEIKIIEGNNA